MHKNKTEILSLSQNLFTKAFECIPFLGFELEFYVTKNSDKNLAKYLEVLSLDMRKIGNFIIEKEQGCGQVEVKTEFLSDFVQVCDLLESAKNCIRLAAQKCDVEVSFESLPFENDCPSSTQFSFSFESKVAPEQKCINSSIYGLLSNTDWMMAVLAPHKEDYLRFDKNRNILLHKAGKYTAPINLSFGYYNRTAAIRIAKSQGFHSKHRIEYRIPSPHCDQYLSAIYLLLAIYSGFERNISSNDLEIFGRVYGNAFDYDMPHFVKSYDLAKDKFESKNNPLKDRFEKLCAGGII